MLTVRNSDDVFNSDQYKQANEERKTLEKKLKALMKQNALAEKELETLHKKVRTLEEEQQANAELKMEKKELEKKVRHVSSVGTVFSAMCS